MSGEVKQRKKNSHVNSDGNHRDTGDKSSKSSSKVDLKSSFCLVLLVVCGALSWMVLQHSRRFSQMEEEFRSLQRRSSSLMELKEEMMEVSQKCEHVRLMQQELEAQRGSVYPQLKTLEQDMGQLKEWALGLTEKRTQLQISLTSLRKAVGLIEERTTAIAKDFSNKVASVRTDVRRMDGLRSELESLLTHVGELEDKTAQVERSMIKRIGDVLAGSIDRVSNLRAASERNTQAIEKLRGRIPELVHADALISDQLRELESGRARLIRTVTFASDLKPKVAAIRRDFLAFEPQMADLTLRIGRLAEDLTQREREIAELRQTLVNLTVVRGELGDTLQQVTEISDFSDIRD
ncbi:inhibitor of nuclear factor kappa-B kinase-interacting protein isoform X2 [Gouania willdenowi]|uniref:Inhibitor of nuclear factor kappa-B kinase-interacting protein n=1 Tax=Gouania willdenowi TaxID=441366 RepID=A0A8C5E752_GOUWI|nr:inhibitor of nuclear factor kappa-B kinase-interacting protein isoform X2 [Gouania willdenowi]